MRPNAGRERTARLKLQRAEHLFQSHRQEGHETVQCSLGITVPAATQLRQVAALHSLRAAFPDAAWLADASSAGEGIADVKTALRQALAPQLGRALGWQVRTVVHRCDDGVIGV
jgi:hypothetical protein